jgi:hypothetical protein
MTLLHCLRNAREAYVAGRHRLLGEDFVDEDGRFGTVYRHDRSELEVAAVFGRACVLSWTKEAA